MRVNRNDVIPTEVDAYAYKLDVLSKNIRLIGFRQHDLCGDIEKTDKSTKVTFTRLRPPVYNNYTCERWDFMLGIDNVPRESYSVLKKYAKEFGLVPYSMVLALDLCASSRAKALDIGRFITGHLIQPKNTDMIVPVYRKARFWIDRGFQRIFEDTPDDLLHFSSKRMKEKQSWDRGYTWRRVNGEITIDPHAVSRKGLPCCRIKIDFHGSYEIKKLGIHTMESFLELDMQSIWARYIQLARLDDEVLSKAIQSKHQGKPEIIKRRIGALKRSTMLELEGEHYPSTHNLVVAAGLSFGKCQKFDPSPYLPA